MANGRGIRQDATQISVSSTPVVRETPMGSSTVPVPYIETVFFDRSADNSTNVRMNGRKAVTDRSRITQVVGSEAGLGDPDDRNVGERKLKKASSSVRINDRKALRNEDDDADDNIATTEES